jgi:hypothetical protein
MDDFIIKWYMEKGPRWCAEQLGISYESAKQKAHSMGLSFRKAKEGRVRAHLELHLLVDGWKKCAKDMGLAEGTIRNWAKKLGVPVPPDDRGLDPYPLTCEQKQTILSGYPKESTNRLAQSMGLTNDIVVSFLQREGKYIGLDRRADLCYNRDFFSWSNDLAYVFGYMCADGSVGQYARIDNDRKPRTMPRSSIASKDKQILDDIRERMGLKAKVCSYCLDGETYHHLTTGCDRVFRLWNKLGVKQRKSFVGIGVPFVPKKYMRHFIRGFFDGDGSFSGGYAVSFGCTDKQFLEWMLDSIMCVIGGKRPVISNLPNNKTPYFCFAIYAKRALKLRDWMAPAKKDLRLQRKWKDHSVAA